MKLHSHIFREFFCNCFQSTFDKFIDDDRYRNIGYLHRPAFKNKGCDFVVNCNPAIPRDDGKRYKNPRHDDLTDELKRISEQISDGKNRILAAVNAVWSCKEISITCASLCDGIDDQDWAFRTERALKVAKWLFIEQDITDWNTSGRNMLMNGIKDVLLK